MKSTIIGGPEQIINSDVVQGITTSNRRNIKDGINKGKDNK
jgi:hypothetical protein